jgi:hypothetical protein
MRPSSSNIFHTSLAFHPSSLTATTSMRVGNRGVGSLGDAGSLRGGECVA